MEGKQNSKRLSLYLAITLTITASANSQICYRGCTFCGAAQGFAYCGSCYRTPNIQGTCSEFPIDPKNPCILFNNFNQCLQCNSTLKMSLSTNDNLCYNASSICTGCTRHSFNRKTNSNICSSCSNGVPNPEGSNCLQFPANNPSFANCLEGSIALGPDGLQHPLCTRCKPTYTVLYSGPLASSCVQTLSKPNLAGCLVYHNDTQTCTLCDGSQSYYMLAPGTNCTSMPISISPHSQQVEGRQGGYDFEEVDSDSLFGE